jgi:D-alanine-D-alanine ligase
MYDESEAGLYTNKIKVELADNFHYLCPAPISPGLEHQLKVYAATVFRVIGCKDVARVDFRLDENQQNKPYILEVNPLPGLSPGISDLCLEAEVAGWSHERLVNTIVELACKRHNLPLAVGVR